MKYEVLFPNRVMAADEAKAADVPATSYRTCTIASIESAIVTVDVHDPYGLDSPILRRRKTSPPQMSAGITRRINSTIPYAIPDIPQIG